MNDIVILTAIFVSVLLVAFTVISAVARMRAIDRNMDSAAMTPSSRDSSADEVFSDENDMIRHYYAVQKQNNPEGLDMRLIRAGFFHTSARRYFNLLRFGLSMVVFILVWWGITTFTLTVKPTMALFVAAISSGVSFILVSAMLDSLGAKKQTSYRRLFPDFMDLLIVCVDSGLSIEAAIDRVAREFLQTNPGFGQHLAIISLEVRAGRPLNEALSNFSNRVKLEEAKTLATLFKQSQELGASVVKTLRVYSSEMRQMRLIRAEEKANSLPIKMLFPLAAFLFPVNLVIVLVPIMIQILNMFTTLKPGG